jgi:hypothetical protein
MREIKITLLYTKKISTTKRARLGLKIGFPKLCTLVSFGKQKKAKQTGLKAKEHA